MTPCLHARMFLSADDEGAGISLFCHDCGFLVKLGVDPWVDDVVVAVAKHTIGTPQEFEEANR
jgi:hypothetical protein